LVDSLVKLRASPQFTAAIGAKVSVADVVGEDEDDVGFPGVGGLRGGEYECQRANERGSEDGICSYVVCWFCLLRDLVQATPRHSSAVSSGCVDHFKRILSRNFF
jgi:hypothetical protein